MSKNERLLAAVNNVLFNQYYLNCSDFNEAMDVLECVYIFSVQQYVVFLPISTVQLFRVLRVKGFGNVCFSIM